MHEIDLHRIDLNLLLVFDSLMQTRSVSKTAGQLHRTQSATSHALERLRQQLGDPLLVRQGGEMVPSPFAEQLQGQLHPLLRQLGQALEPAAAFDPATSTRSFRLAMHDFLGGLFPDLLHLVQTQAPQVRLEWALVRPNVLEALIDGQIDLFIGPAPMALPAGVEALAMGAMGWACYAHERHPALHQWGEQQWAQWPHVQVGVGDPVRNPVTQAAQQRGLVRHVAVSVPLFSSVAPALANSDLLATLPRAVMRDQTGHWGLVERPTPFPIEPIEHALYSARRLAADPAQQWFKGLVQQALAPFMDRAN